MAEKKIPQQQIYERISRFAGTVGLYVENLDSGEIFEINPGHVFCSASTIKIPILGLLLKDVEEGKVDWNLPVTVPEENRVGGTGIYFKLDSYYTPTLKTLALLMIILSDNAATNQIIDTVGIDRINNFCQSLGYVNTTCGRKMMDLKARQEGKDNYTCAGEIGRMLHSIALGEFVSESASKTIHEFMAKQMCNNKLPSKLPAVPCFWPDEDRVTIRPDMVLCANKTGDFYRVEHDVGIFTLPNGSRYIVAMLTGDVNDAKDAINAIGDISKIVYEAMK